MNAIKWWVTVCKGSEHFHPFVFKRLLASKACLVAVHDQGGSARRSTSATNKAESMQLHVQARCMQPTQSPAGVHPPQHTNLCHVLTPTTAGSAHGEGWQADVPDSSLSCEGDTSIINVVVQGCSCVCSSAFQGGGHRQQRKALN